MKNDLVSWLLEQIAADEREAGDYHERDCGYGQGQPHFFECDCGHPQRLLAECEAKRRIIELHEKIRAAYPDATIESDPCCAVCSAAGEYPGGEYPGDGYPCPTLRLLALPYAYRPGYREEWRP